MFRIQIDGFFKTLHRLERAAHALEHETFAKIQFIAVSIFFQCMAHPLQSLFKRLRLTQQHAQVDIHLLILRVQLQGTAVLLNGQGVISTLLQ